MGGCSGRVQALPTAGVFIPGPPLHRPRRQPWLFRSNSGIRMAVLRRDPDQGPETLASLASIQAAAGSSGPSTHPHFCSHYVHVCRELESRESHSRKYLGLAWALRVLSCTSPHPCKAPAASDDFQLRPFLAFSLTDTRAVLGRWGRVAGPWGLGTQWSSPPGSPSNQEVCVTV